MGTKAKRVAALVLAVMMAAGAMTACKKKGDTEGESSSTPETSSTSKSSSSSKAEKKKPSDYQVTVSKDNKTKMEDAKKVNKDVVAWLEVPNTEINEPVVQTTDNEKYYRLNWKGESDFEGCLWMDYEVKMGKGTASDMPQNTIIYGHHTGVDENKDGQGDGTKDNPDGREFSQLLKFQDIEFAKKTPYIYLTTPGEDLIYQVFGVVDTEENMSPVRYNFTSYDKKYLESLPYPWIKQVPASYNGNYFKALVDDIKARSIYNYKDVEVGDDDKIISLSTCHYAHGTYAANNQQRFVIFAKLVTDKNFSETANITKVNNPKQPQF